GAEGVVLRRAGRKFGPVVSMDPSAFTTCPASTVAEASAGGAATGSPFASRHVPGAYQYDPSPPRTNTHGENVTPGGSMTHCPGFHAHRPRRHDHSPSTHTVSPCGRGGTISTREGGGGRVTPSKALAGWGV
ncbi:MAG: hypothetical protein ACRENE_30490, partial [Polyangiaceae bacterium]